MKKITKCPYCGWTQKTGAEKSVKCIRCKRSYSIFPKTKRSRIVKYVK